MKQLLFALCLGGQLISMSAYAQDGQRRPNVLFIAVDDLKPVLGCYGDELVKSHNIDRIAERGTVFLSNYCQQAVCGPTRASLMTGRRPDYTKVWDLKTRMRDVNPGILSIPQYFISQGYVTAGIGKVYDPRCVDRDLDALSWSIPYFRDNASYFASETGVPAYYYQLPETRREIEEQMQEAAAKGFSGSELRQEVLRNVKPSVECADVPDNAYLDGTNARYARDILSELARGDKPFFFAVGFSKPHLPFVAPKKYWDLYERSRMLPAGFQEHSRAGFETAYHNSGELRSYTDIPPLCSYSGIENRIGLPAWKQRELIHGYYACVSYTDAQVGLLLDALDSLGLRGNTIIVLWGDHGWHLGDHDLWNKHSNFEQATRSPLIISAPGFGPSRSSSPSEFVDVFPTLCELAGLEIPESLDGISLAAEMRNPGQSQKTFAVSQYPRSASPGIPGVNRLGYETGKIMGYSVRTEKYRYTLWMGNDFRSYQPYDETLVVARELYDYTVDPLETRNLVSSKKYREIQKEMDAILAGFFKSQESRGEQGMNHRTPTRSANRN